VIGAMSRRRLIWIAALIWLAASPALAIFVWRYTDRRTDIYKTQFGFGAVVESLVERHEYAAPSIFPGNDFTSRAHRMPLVPFFIAAIAAFTRSMAAAYAIKAVVFGAIGFAAWALLAPLVSGRRLALAVALLLLFPQFIGRAFDVHTEEGYLIDLLGLLTVLLLRIAVRRQAARWEIDALAGLNAAVFLTKSGQLPYTLGVCALTWALTRDWRRATAVAAALVLAAGGWGLATWARTGRLTLGTSWDGWNFGKGNNARTLELYPRLHLDLLDHVPYPDVRAANEWAYEDAQMDAALSFIRSHPGQTLRALTIKAFVALVDVRQNGVLSEKELRFQTIRAVGVGFMVLFRIASWALALWSARAIVRRLKSGKADAAYRLALVFLIPTALYLAPYLAGFVYERHVMPLVMTTALCALAAWPGRASAARAPAHEQWATRRVAPTGG
jgi:hypothetical protein